MGQVFFEIHAVGYPGIFLLSKSNNMKTKENENVALELSYEDRISHQLGALLKRRIISAALTLGYWTLVLVWSFFSY